jgi:hypothetical protein
VVGCECNSPPRHFAHARLDLRLVRSRDGDNTNYEGTPCDPISSNREVPSMIALVGGHDGIELNEHMEHDGAALVFQHTCKLGSDAAFRPCELAPLSRMLIA